MSHSGSTLLAGGGNNHKVSTAVRQSRHWVGFEQHLQESGEERQSAVNSSSRHATERSWQQGYALTTRTGRQLPSKPAFCHASATSSAAVPPRTRVHIISQSATSEATNAAASAGPLSNPADRHSCRPSGPLGRSGGAPHSATSTSRSATLVSPITMQGGSRQRPCRRATQG